MRQKKETQPWDTIGIAAYIRERTKREEYALAQQRKTKAKKRYRKEKKLKQNYYIPDPTEISANQLEFLCLLEASGLIHEALDTIPLKLKRILELHYFEDMSLHEIAKYYSLSYGRIYQLHKKALRMLRHPERIKFLDETIYTSYKSAE